MPYCDANSACDSPSFARSARTSTGSLTLTIRTGNEISPRANATASFSPATMSRATRERLARSVGAFEVFNDLADFFLVGIRQVLLRSGHHRVSFRVRGNGVFHLGALVRREQFRDPLFIDPRRDYSRIEHASTIRESRTECQD